MYGDYNNSLNKTNPRLTVISRGLAREYDLKGEQILGRPTERNIPDIPVNSAVVSRIHGRFVTDLSGCSYIDEGSTNGTFYNGALQKKGRAVMLSDGDVMRIHGRSDDTGKMDVTLIFSSRSVMAEKRPSGPGLSVNIKERNVWQRFGKKTLLRDIRVNIPSGSMVLVLGGSGAGKTTFMNAVMGYERAEGTVSYNGVDIYREYDHMKYEIGYVPQQDLLRLNDTVYDTLRNAARMRLPVMDEAYYRKQVDDTLLLMGLEAHGDSLVGKLSGGQRKRLSIAVEYVGDPSLFFLDEPDSGLDGMMARRLMESLRTIADQGRIVIVISHNPDRVKDLFDQVIVLAKDSDKEGRLAFSGAPEEACSFFRVNTLEEIIRKINPPEEGGVGEADHYIRKYYDYRKG